MNSTKHSLKMTALAAAIAFSVGVSAQEPTDFSGYSTDNLVRMRSQVRNMSKEDQLRYRTEIQHRARDMTPEQRAEAGAGPEAGQSQGQRQAGGEQLRDDSVHRVRTGNTDRPREGSGSGQGGGKGRRGDDGSASRVDATDYPSYGSGYQSRREQDRGRPRG